MSIYEQLESRSLRFIEAYHEDLTKHDRAALEQNPGMSFLHWTRDYGTYIVMFPESSDPAYPKDGQRVPYLFGTADREHILDGKLIQAKHMLNHEGLRLTLYFDGTHFTETSASRAVTICEGYVRSIKRSWNSERRTADQRRFRPFLKAA